MLYKAVKATNKHPHNHAGHQTHHTTTCVHIPHTSHPKAASVIIISTVTFRNQQMANSIAAGDMRFISTKVSIDICIEGDGGWEGGESFRSCFAFPVLWSFRIICSLLRGDVGSLNPINVRGAQRRPISRESEKFRVASAERKRPRNRREKDFNRRNCCGVGGFRNRVRIVAKPKGRRRLMKVKA